MKKTSSEAMISLAKKTSADLDCLCREYKLDETADKWNERFKAFVIRLEELDNAAKDIETCFEEFRLQCLDQMKELDDLCENNPMTDDEVTPHDHHIWAFRGMITSFLINS